MNYMSVVGNNKRKWGGGKTLFKNNDNHKFN